VPEAEVVAEIDDVEHELERAVEPYRNAWGW
jgi:hypothetical protein